MLRPRYRGVSHRFAFFGALVAGAILLANARDGARLATAIYVVTLAAMFGVSATLHRADYGPRVYNWLRRADHAVIFLCIGGTYTPFALLGLGGERGDYLLALAWLVNGLGVVRALAWPHAPRLVTSAFYVAAGWVVLACLPEFYAAVDATTFALSVAGGVIFTTGAGVYALRWPDPSPHVFGYHEVFHVLVIAGCACHYAAVVRLAT